MYAFFLGLELTTLQAGRRNTRPLNQGWINLYKSSLSKLLNVVESKGHFVTKIPIKKLYF